MDDPEGFTINRPGSNIGKPADQPQAIPEVRYQFVDNFSYELGAHRLKFGTDISHITSDGYLYQNNPGVFTFTTDRPFDPADLSTYPVSFLKNEGDVTFKFTNTNVSLFAQDAWRVHQTLTLNVGVRYDMYRITGADMDAFNLAPRLGVAWDPFGTGKTTVRGGFGVFYNSIMFNVPIFTAFFANQRSILINNPGFPDPYSRPGTPGTVPISTYRAEGDDQAVPRTYSVTIGMQRELALGASAVARQPVAAPAPPDRVGENPKVTAAVEAARVWLEAERDFSQIPGVSAAIVHDQDVLWIGGFGHADLARKSSAGPDTLYSICSISKLFTSIAVMQQRDAGRLRLDDPVNRILPWLDIEVTSPDGGDITVEGLLTHASGLPRETNQAYWTGPDFVFPTREEIRAGLKRQKTLYPAETYFQYSNLGLTLAGEVAAQVAGRPYAELVRAQILDPLGMSSTFPEMPAGERGRRLATGYSAITRAGTRDDVPFFEARGVAPAAGYASTAADLARFASWQFRLLASGGTEVLKATTLREMQRVHWVDPDFETTWGLGFSVWRSSDKVFTGHGGSCPGFRSQVLLKPDEKIATIVLANAQGVDTSRLAQRMYDLVAPAIREAARARPDAPAPVPADPALTPYVGLYTSGFSGEIAVLRWEDGLATLGLPSADPARAIARLRRTGDHVFRRVRKDEALAEELVFEIGPDGRASRFTWHNNHYRRVR